MTADRISRRSLVAGAGMFGAGAALGLTDRSAAARSPMPTTAAPRWYRFKHGQFTCTVISDGPLPLSDPAALFVGSTADDVTKALADNFLPTDQVVLEQNALVLDTGKDMVLFDNGMGTAKTFGPTTGRLLANLRSSGIESEDITAICFTHAHLDHCWGTINDEGRPNFPNAQLYIAESELAFWTDEERLAASTGLLRETFVGARRHLLPNRDRIVYVKDGQEPLPGIQAISTPGHTVGHTSYMIASEVASLCNIGDLAHHQVLLIETPRLEFAYDTDRKLAVSSRLRLLDMLANERVALLAYHFPWPGIGHVARMGDGFRYYPAPMRAL
jgi:glyoxylase-like metal-dependent hydrolase (beta-lactamase superfamily II)